MNTVALVFGACASMAACLGAVTMLIKGLKAKWVSETRESVAQEDIIRRLERIEHRLHITDRD